MLAFQCFPSSRSLSRPSIAAIYYPFAGFASNCNRESTHVIDGEPFNQLLFVQEFGRAMLRKPVQKQSSEQERRWYRQAAGRANHR